VASRQLGAGEFSLCDPQSTQCANSRRDWYVGRHLVLPAVSSSPGRAPNNDETRSSQCDSHRDHIVGHAEVWQSRRGQRLPKCTDIPRAGHRFDRRAFSPRARYGRPWPFGGSLNFDEPASVLVAVALSLPRQNSRPMPRGAPHVLARNRRRGVVTDRQSRRDLSASHLRCLKRRSARALAPARRHSRALRSRPRRPGSGRDRAGRPGGRVRGAASRAARASRIAR
jgi:hypothetical protein